jgi:hypothetical protein
MFSAYLETKRVSTIPITIKDHENVDAGMDASEFAWVVRDEFATYVPKLERFAKTHPEEKCHTKVRTWCAAGHIHNTTRDVLGDYITKVLFAPAA